MTNKIGSKVSIMERSGMIERKKRTKFVFEGKKKIADFMIRNDNYIKKFPRSKSKSFLV